MWNNLAPQQQQFLMQMLRGGQNQPMNPAMFGGQQPAFGQMQPPMGSQGLGNPLMTGGNSAINPQQQAAMMQYQQMLASPQGWGAAANGNVPVWQLLMGRGPWYGQGTAVP